jgi:hypothetical protein
MSLADPSTVERQAPIDEEAFGKFIADLDSLRTSDPVTFMGIMKSMGLSKGPDANNEVDPTASSKSESDLDYWSQVLKQYQARLGIDSSVSLPGGKAYLGPKGVEEKVCILFTLYYLSFLRKLFLFAFSIKCSRLVNTLPQLPVLWLKLKTIVLLEKRYIIITVFARFGLMLMNNEFFFHV